MGSDALIRYVGVSVRISIHAPAWGATWRRLSRQTRTFLFQSTLPHGERLIAMGWTEQDFQFQSTLPHGERRALMLMVIGLDLFQSTLPHGERREHVDLWDAVDWISIHAPAWGATSFDGTIFGPWEFQSTLPHGERRERLGSADAASDFNPRSRMGSDVRIMMLQHGARISIHAPAWGATPACIRMGRVFRFQSTLPHGERPNRTTQTATERKISIHAPAWGATERLPLKLISKKISIHAPAWGATRQPKSTHTNEIFQSTLPHGERPTLVAVAEQLRMAFQSTLPHGERRTTSQTLCPMAYFNPRSRMGSDRPDSNDSVFAWKYFNPRSRMGSDT